MEFEPEGSPAGGDEDVAVDDVDSAMGRPSSEAVGEPDSDFTGIEEGLGRSNSSLAVVGTVESSRTAGKEMDEVRRARGFSRAHEAGFDSGG